MCQFKDSSSASALPKLIVQDKQNGHIWGEIDHDILIMELCTI